MIKKDAVIDYSKTLYLPQTSFAMRANLVQRELDLIKRWEEIDIYMQLRDNSRGNPPYTLHDGPPYANGNIHIGHALNKILKDIIVRSFQMRGYNANYVPGWDCHGLPIEWKIEEEYRTKGKDKNSVPVNEFRRECREFASRWVAVQTNEFKRLGIFGDFKNPYTTMNFHAEARITKELIKFAMSGQLYCRSKPIMWSVVERTVLAEAEVEYYEQKTETLWIKFPVKKTKKSDLAGAFVIIWTTTPWTIPGNRAVAFSSNISYGLYEVVAQVNYYGPQKGQKILVSISLAKSCSEQAKITLQLIRKLDLQELEELELSHPLKGLAQSYLFSVPLLAGEHVTDEIGTGFVHTAPSHGQEDFNLWISYDSLLKKRGINNHIPCPVDEAGFYTTDAPGFGPDRPEGAARVVNDLGDNGNANTAVIAALIEADHVFARGYLKHFYPHSWRSKKPIIFRNTPQWFIAMDKDLGDGTSLRSRALQSIKKTRFVPLAGQMRLHTMIVDRPDWVISRQRSWGVPIAIFVNDKNEILRDEAVNERIISAFEQEGADAWFAKGARARFLQDLASESWEMITDILDVWFDSGTTHTFTLEDRKDLHWPADVYIEGSDQHRGWFHSSLLESCGTRGEAPYKTVITHGFTVDEYGQKMSKSIGNGISPQYIVNTFGADILRLWVITTNYQEDQRLGNNIIQTNVAAYRKLRNVIRWMLGVLFHFPCTENSMNDLEITLAPDLEQFMLHQLYEVDKKIRYGYDAFDFKLVIRTLLDFAIIDLSAFYFDIRKDSLYCDAPSSKRRIVALKTVRTIFKHFITWLAPMLPFTTEEAWLTYMPDSTTSIHLEQFPKIPPSWENQHLANCWNKIRQVRRVVNGALELERVARRIGSSLEAAPLVFINEKTIYEAVKNVDMAEICITSDITLTTELPTKKAFYLEDVTGVAVESKKAKGKRCARSWRYTQDVGKDPDFVDVSARDAAALREMRMLGMI